MSIKVSIIVPVYNSAKYLEKCLDSICNQTLQDIEIICVDDCSTDNSYSILKKYAQKDKRILLIKQASNQGQGIARNTGLKLAKREYIGFVDSDDAIDENYFESLYERAQKNEADITSNCLYYVSENNQLKEGDWFNFAQIEKECLTDRLEKMKTVYANCNTSPCKHIYKSKFLKEHKIEFQNGVFHEDQYFIVKAFYYANKIIQETSNCPKYFYFLHENSSMHQKNNKQKYRKVLKGQFVVFSKILDFFKTQNATFDIIKYFEDIFFEICKRNIECIELEEIKNYTSFAYEFWKNNKLQKLKIFYYTIARILNIQKDIRHIQKHWNRFISPLVYILSSERKNHAK